jgi:hypothetical protein
VIAEEGISQEERAEGIAAAREQRMQQLLYAITVLASTSGMCIAKSGRSGVEAVEACMDAHAGQRFRRMLALQQPSETMR